MSLNKWGEQLCGDRVEIVEQGENSSVIVLADGMGSGVKPTSCPPSLPRSSPP